MAEEDAEAVLLLLWEPPCFDWRAAGAEQLCISCWGEIIKAGRFDGRVDSGRKRKQLSKRRRPD